MFNWKDAGYLESVERFAKIMAKSRAVNPAFHGDEATCSILIMLADKWNIDDPIFVGANSYYDQYMRLAQTGKLMRTIISNHPNVKALTTTYDGKWDKVENASRFDANLGRIVGTWDPTIESGLSLTIEITFEDESPSFKETVRLSDVDLSYRSLNESWANAPRKQLFNHMIRNIGHFELAELVSGYDVSDAMKMEAQESSMKNSRPVQIRPEQSSKPKKMAMNHQQHSPVVNETNAHLAAINKLYNTALSLLVERENQTGDEAEPVSEHDVQNAIASMFDYAKAQQEHLNCDEREIATKQYLELYHRFTSLTQTAA